jgi:hypothetical protein
MGRMKSAESKQPKRKAVKVSLCERLNAGQVTEPYRIMESIIDLKRPDLQDVKIGIAWHTGWRPDSDGLRTHGKCVRRSELDRAMDTFDFILVLSKISWKAFDDQGKERLIFHELEHAQVCMDKNGKPLIDDKDRIVTRVKRHDVADFSTVIERYGLPPVLKDMDLNDADRPLLELSGKKEKASAASETKNKKEEQGQDAVAVENGEPEGKVITIEPSFKGIKNCSVIIRLAPEGDGWSAGYSVILGNREIVIAGSDGPTGRSRVECLGEVRTWITEWVRALTMKGKAEIARRGRFLKQWAAMKLDIIEEPIGRGQS